MRLTYLALTGALVLGLGPRNDAMAQSRFFTFERNTNLPGQDYRSVPSEGATDCSFVCQAENRCRAWTYVKRGRQGPSGVCWLKGAVPGRQGNDCCTSGVRTSAPTRHD